jgi:hypothetical protein
MLKEEKLILCKEGMGEKDLNTNKTELQCERYQAFYRHKGVQPRIRQIALLD